MDFNQLLPKYAKIVEKAVQAECDRRIRTGKKLGDANKFYYEAAKEFIMRGGKRLRPISFIMAYQGIAGKKNLSEVIKAAVGIEMLHNGTLSHDDIMDQDRMRRGGPTSWVVFSDWHRKNFGAKGADHFGESMAILQGDTYTSLAFSQLLERNLDPERVLATIRYMNRYYNTVNEGQLFDMILEKKRDVTEKDYLQMVKMKTGALFEAAIIMGAALAGADRKKLDLFSKYATLIGQAFQMQDDVLGVFGSEEKFGKPTDSDIKEGKRTLMVIYALSKANTQEKAVLINTLGNRNASPDDVEAVRQILKRTGGADYCISKAKQLAISGKKYIQKLKLQGESRDFFLGLADFVVNREI